MQTWQALLSFVSPQWPFCSRLGILHRVSTARTDYQKLAAFRYALRRFLRFSEQAAAEVGLTPQQHQALLAIEGYPERNYATITELAERLQLTHHSVVGLLDRLERSHFITRRSSSKDRRLVLVQLSPQGRRVLRKLTRSHKEHLRRFAPEIGSALESLA
jgi:DNA-binding MarR family transcriptional regulator